MWWNAVCVLNVPYGKQLLDVCFSKCFNLSLNSTFCVVPLEFDNGNVNINPVISTLDVII